MSPYSAHRYETFDRGKAASRSLERFMPALRERYRAEIDRSPAEWAAYETRLAEHFPALFSILIDIYGDAFDFYYHLQQLVEILTASWVARSDSLKICDRERLDQPDWFLSNQMLGGVCYVDLFAGNLNGIAEKIPYFKELGLTYLHLMPLFKAPPGENDGGYAISSYREVEPALGTMEQLQALAGELRENGISLVVDFVFNHTSNQHTWAEQATAGDEAHQAYYWMFDDRKTPNAFEPALREIFPDEHPGAFTRFDPPGKWIWTTFHRYQWDLNYQNPEVFNRMTEEMLFLANVGVEVLRLDAVAFIWKEMGTASESRPEAYRLVDAFNLAARIAAPSLLFKSEAIVHPDEVIRYIAPTRCQISYNPLLMALLWESLATREVRLLAASLRDRFAIPEGCAWVNYVRCHDDIGWTFSDEDAAQLGINGYDHRRFLNAFYTGRFPGGFARGLPFQENPRTGDCRISGTLASLAGLEKALTEETAREVDLAVRRVLLLHAVVLTIGGIPLLYLGDEIGMLNDRSFRANPEKAHDSRWVHRVKANPQAYERRNDPTTVEGKVFGGLKRLIALRKAHAVFGSSHLQMIDTGSAHVLAYLKSDGFDRVLVLANFSEQQIELPEELTAGLGFGLATQNLVTGKPLPKGAVRLMPYEFAVLR